MKNDLMSIGWKNDGEGKKVLKRIFFLLWEECFVKGLSDGFKIKKSCEEKIVVVWYCEDSK